MQDDNQKNRPLILITNDDGINSPGLKALAEAISPFSDLLIAAPKEQQTGMGRGFLKGDTVGTIEPKKMDINGQSIIVYAIDASPAQSVAHAVLELMDRLPDYCVSGVNYGENLGLAYTCSGTLGAAFEADSLGIPAVAFSRAFPLNNQKSNNFKTLNWESEKYHIGNIIRNIINNGIPKDVRILNINFPIGLNRETEIRITRQAYMNYSEYIIPKDRNFSNGHKLKWKLNSKIKNLTAETDIFAVNFDKVISITPLTSRMSVKADNYYNC